MDHETLQTENAHLRAMLLSNKSIVEGCTKRFEGMEREIDHLLAIAQAAGSLMCEEAACDAVSQFNALFFLQDALEKWRSNREVVTLG